MLYRKIKYCVIIILLFSSMEFEILGEDNSQNGRKNYLELKKMYYKWDSGFFGSRKLYRNRLYRLLTDMIGTDIQTGADFRIEIPELFEKQYYSSDLYNENWLHIHGPAADANIKEIKEKGNDYIKEVERNKYLFFLSGRIEKFRIIETEYGRDIHLYLESVKITQFIK